MAFKKLGKDLESIMRKLRGLPKIDKDVINGKIDSSGDVTPLVFGLSQNYPNPFNTSTTITYTLEKAGGINIIIYDFLGQEIKKLVSDSREPGHYSIIWNGTNNNGNKVTSGPYIVEIRQDNYLDTKKMLVST